MKTATYQLEPLTCPSCVKKIEGTLKKQPGVSEARVLFHSSKVKTSFDETIVNAKELNTIIEKLGYPVLASKES
ncbi:heavy-metal-associated domain-containing protein [Cytobacillus sp. FJAT-53684]|uniref:Heavy-metal-associated domain-containing protein n=1 Tax=Cytobacillus mangrovibacter TaxID=3299024 RepID=A0ABW6K498_9BACI